MTQIQGPCLKKTKFLLIDDTTLTRSVLRTILKDEGYTEIREAKDADSGFKMVEHFAPDVICLDIQMPGKSGLELLVELKVFCPDTPVLMITANSDRESIAASFQAGAAGYIVKPFSAAKVLDTINGVLEKISGTTGR